MKIYGRTDEPIWDGDEKQHSSVFVNDGRSVTFILSKMITGVRRDNGKRWHRWEDVSSFGLWKNNNGTLIPFAKIGKRWTSPTLLFLTLGGAPIYAHENEEAVSIFKDNVKKQFNVSTFEDVYPFAREKELTFFEYIPFTLRHDFRATNAMEFTISAFGKRQYRKDLVKAVARSKVNTIAIAKEFRGLVPVDWLVDFMNRSNTQGTNSGHVPSFRHILKNIDPRSYRRLLRESIDDNDVGMVSDVINIYRARVKRKQPDFIYPEDPVRSFTDLHDKLVGARSTYVPVVNEVIELTPLAEKLNDFTFSGLKIVVPRETDVLREWGAYMNNCIGSYASNAVEGASIFAAVYKKDDLIANLQITRNKLSQLLGRFNRNLSDEDRIPVENALRSVGVNVPEYYWGSPYPECAPALEGVEAADEPNPFGELVF